MTNNWDNYNGPLPAAAVGEPHRNKTIGKMIGRKIFEEPKPENIINNGDNTNKGGDHRRANDHHSVVPHSVRPQREQDQMKFPNGATFIM